MKVWALIEQLNDLDPMLDVYVDRNCGLVELEGVYEKQQPMKAFDIHQPTLLSPCCIREGVTDDSKVVNVDIVVLQS